MATRAGDQVVRMFFDFMLEGNREIVSGLVDDPEVVLDEARNRLEAMLPDLAYIDNPSHPMASSVFMCQVSLAVWLSLAARGVDVHAYGNGVLEQVAKIEMPMPDGADALLAAANESLTSAAKGEFVFDVTIGDGPLEMEMNVRSCAICAAFSKHDAMELVPYMCASDDIVSDKTGQGLRRTGTIALGADHCDFRYAASNEPLRLDEQYPLQIRVKPS